MKETECRRPTGGSALIFLIVEPVDIQAGVTRHD